MLAGIGEILVFSTSEDLPRFRALLGNGKRWGLSFSYAEQARPDGLAQAFLIGEEFLEGKPSCLVIGDIIFFGDGLTAMLQNASRLQQGAKVFGCPVSDPERYGVVELGSDGRAISIEEKPQKPKSNCAVSGLYFYDGRAFFFAPPQTITTGRIGDHRPELRLSGGGGLMVEELGRGFSRLDTGTTESLLQAGEFVHVMRRGKVSRSPVPRRQPGDRASSTEGPLSPCRGVGKRRLWPLPAAHGG
jgi:glucose-1-phosphate thymidylyltransferase